MNKKTQRILSIIIGLALAGLLVYIGVRIVQQRSTQASVQSLTCNRLSETSVEAVAVTSNDVPVLFKYGTQAPTFFARVEQNEIEPQGDGTYRQAKTLEQVSGGTLVLQVEGMDDLETTCQPFTGGTVNDGDTQDIVPPVTEPPVTEAPVTEAPVTEAPIEPPAVEKQALSVDMAVAFFEDNADAYVPECVDEFEDEYIGLGYACSQGYQQTQ